MSKIIGLDELSRTLEQAQKALESLNGELGSVQFDPNDPASIDTAIRQVEALVDQRLAAYSSNKFVAQIANGAKEQFRQQILDRAAQARLKTSGEDA